MLKKNIHFLIAQTVPLWLAYEAGLIIFDYPNTLSPIDLMWLVVVNFLIGVCTTALIFERIYHPLYMQHLAKTNQAFSSKESTPAPTSLKQIFTVVFAISVMCFILYQSYTTQSYVSILPTIPLLTLCIMILTSLGAKIFIRLSTKNLDKATIDTIVSPYVFDLIGFIVGLYLMVYLSEPNGDIPFESVVLFTLVISFCLQLLKINLPRSNQFTF